MDLISKDLIVIYEREIKEENKMMKSKASDDIRLGLIFISYY